MTLRIFKSPQKFIEIDLIPGGKFRVKHKRADVTVVIDDTNDRAINLGTGLLSGFF